MKKIASLLSIIFILGVLCTPVVGYAQLTKDMLSPENMTQVTGSANMPTTNQTTAAGAAAVPVPNKPYSEMTPAEQQFWDTRNNGATKTPEESRKIVEDKFGPIETHTGEATVPTATQNTPATESKCAGGITNSDVTCYEPLSPIIDPATGEKVVATNFPQYMQTIYRIGIGACFALGVIMFTWAGIEYIVSESFGVKSDAKKRMTNALIGLAIALASFIILQTINPDLLNLVDLKAKIAEQQKAVKK